VTGISRSTTYSLLGGKKKTMAARNPRTTATRKTTRRIHFLRFVDKDTMINLCAVLSLLGYRTDGTSISVKLAGSNSNGLCPAPPEIQYRSPTKLPHQTSSTWQQADPLGWGITRLVRIRALEGHSKRISKWTLARELNPRCYRSMPITDVAKKQLAQRHRLFYKICRSCGVRNSAAAYRCRKCRSSSLRWKKRELGAK